MPITKNQNLFNDVVAQLEILKKELVILEIMESCLCQLLQETVQNLNAPGKITMERNDFLLRQRGREYFWINFYPSEQDQAHYVVCHIGFGNFLEKNFRLYCHSHLPEYVVNRYVPVIKELFAKMGFKEQFSEKLQSKTQIPPQVPSPSQNDTQRMYMTKNLEE